MPDRMRIRTDWELADYTAHLGADFVLGKVLFCNSAHVTRHSALLFGATGELRAATRIGCTSVNGIFRVLPKYSRRFHHNESSRGIKTRKPEFARNCSIINCRSTSDSSSSDSEPNRIARRHEQLPSRDVFPDAERDDCMTGDVPPALDSLPTSLPHISTPHTRDLDFIKAQIARLPRRTEQ
jgi:hypothetical protein